MALGIKKVTSEVQQRPMQVEAYEIPVIREMELEDGSTARVVVQKVRITKEQLQQQIAQAQSQLDEAKAKLAEIEALPVE